MKGTDRKEVLTNIAEKCGRLIDGLSKEEQSIFRSSMKIDAEGDTDESEARFS